MKRLVAIGDSSIYRTDANVFLITQNIGKEFGFDEVENYEVKGVTISSETDWRPTMASCEYIREFLPDDMALISSGAND